MAADQAIVQFAVQKLGDALIQKVTFLKDVEDKIRWLKDELESMRCFLKDAAEKQGNDESIRKWISDVQEAALDAEDALDAYVLKVDTPQRFAWSPFHVFHLDRVGKEIESIRTRLQEIKERRQTYGIQNLGSGSGLGSGRKGSEDFEWRRRLPCLPKDEDVVGLNEDVKVLLQKLIMEEKKDLSVAAIVGMGGIGKSTLARKIYEHKDVVEKFKCRAWVVVSSEFAPEETIKYILPELQNSEEKEKKVRKDIEDLEKSTKDRLLFLEKLQNMLKKELEGKTYFIVLDDVWEKNHLDFLKTAFPHEKGEYSQYSADCSCGFPTVGDPTFHLFQLGYFLDHAANIEKEL